MNTPCKDNPEPYDVLIDVESGPGYRAALREAVNLCKTCPLEVAAKCFTDNAEESWVKAIREAKHAPRKRPECGTSWGLRKHAAAKEHTCAACRDFTREKERARREKRRAA